MRTSVLIHRAWGAADYLHAGALVHILLQWGQVLIIGVLHIRSSRLRHIQDVALQEHACWTHVQEAPWFRQCWLLCHQFGKASCPTAGEPCFPALYVMCKLMTSITQYSSRVGL